MSQQDDIRETVRQVIREELASLLTGLAAQLRGGAPPPAGGALSHAAMPGSPPGPTDPVLIAVITAAAVAAMGGGGAPVRVRRITFVNHNTISGWAESGRLNIHASHNTRRTL